MFKIGKKYLVDVAIVKAAHDGFVHIVPILPLKHKDASFGVDAFHYHIDCRFFMEEKTKKEWMVKKNKTVAPIWCDKPGYCTILSIEKRMLQCVSTVTGFDMNFMLNPTTLAEEKVGLYWKWYEGMIGKSCAGKKCPHYGTDMIAVGNKLVCPMHNLIADRKTETIIAYPKKQSQCQHSPST